jgi:hypothetical protein
MNGKSKEPVVAALETWNDFDEKIYLGTKMGIDPSVEGRISTTKFSTTTARKGLSLISESPWSTESPPL